MSVVQRLKCQSLRLLEVVRAQRPRVIEQGLD
jgi:hypothetical protein